MSRKLRGGVGGSCIDLDLIGEIGFRYVSTWGIEERVVSERGMNKENRIYWQDS